MIFRGKQHLFSKGLGPFFCGHFADKNCSFLVEVEPGFPTLATESVSY